MNENKYHSLCKCSILSANSFPRTLLQTLLPSSLRMCDTIFYIQLEKVSKKNIEQNYILINDGQSIKQLIKIKTKSLNYKWLQDKWRIPIEQYNRV